MFYDFIIIIKKFNLIIIIIIIKIYIELKKLLTGLGISKNETEIDDLFNNFDKDKSGSIEFEEFVDLVHKLNWK